MATQYKRWPSMANEQRENAIAHMQSIEEVALSSLKNAQARKDTDEVVRQSQIIINAQAAKYGLELAYHIGRAA